jgi:hypothetical protein
MMLTFNLHKLWGQFMLFRDLDTAFVTMAPAYAYYQQSCGIESGRS